MSQPKPLDFDQPPIFKETKSNPTATLDWLKPTLSTIYETARATQSIPTLTRRAYLNVYTAAHDYVEITKHSDASPSALDLYNALEAEIRTHCIDVRKSRLLLALDNDTIEISKFRHILASYLSQYKQLNSLATLSSHLLQHLERHWIKREIDEQQFRILHQDNEHTRAAGSRPERKVVHFIKDLYSRIWIEEVLQAKADGGTDVAEEMARAIEMLKGSEDGDGTGESDKDLAKRFSEAVRSIVVDAETGEKQWTSIPPSLVA